MREDREERREKSRDDKRIERDYSYELLKYKRREGFDL